MDQFDELQEKIEDVKHLREQIQSKVSHIRLLKRELDAACDEAESILADVRSATDEELSAMDRVFWIGGNNLNSGPKRKIIDRVVQVLKHAGKPLPAFLIVTNMKKLGWRPKAQNPHASVYSVLKTELGRKTRVPRVRKLDDGTWALR